MSNPDNMPDNDFVWHYSYNKEASFGRYENDSAGAATQVHRKMFVKLFIIAAVVFLIFAGLFVVVFSQSQDLADKKHVLAIEKRLDQLETEFTALKTYIASKLEQAIQEMERDKNAIAPQKPLSAKTPPPPQQEQNDLEPKIHKIRSGDSLSRISRQYGLSIEQLRNYNNLEPNATIYPGQELKLTP